MNSEGCFISVIAIQKTIDTRLIFQRQFEWQRVRQQFAYSPFAPCGNSRNPKRAMRGRVVRKQHPKNIQILNPVSDGRFTSANRARRFVAQGRAEWAQVGVSIRFIASDRRHQSADKSARYWYDRAAHSGVARLADLANLPMIAPSIMLGLGKRKGASRHTFLAARGLG